MCTPIADSLYHAAEAQFKIKYNPLPPQQETWKKLKSLFKSMVFFFL